MSKQAGLQGEVKIGSAELDLTRDATLSLNVGMADVTARDSGGWRERVPTINEWAISCNAVFKEGDAVLATVRNAHFAKTKLSDVKFIYEGNEGLKGDAYVESIEAGQPFEDADTYDIVFQGDGAPTYQSGLLS